MRIARSFAALSASLFAALSASHFLFAGIAAIAHEGHPEHAPAAASAADSAKPAGAYEGKTTGGGDFVFRYRADLSELPAEVAKGIKAAHGGFAKHPSGDVYFGLQGTGLVRISADLKTKELVSAAGDLLGGGLHNTTYVDRDGGLLVLPDNVRGQVLVVRPDGSAVGKLGRPAVNDYYTATKPGGRPKNGYNPTDTEVGADGVLYVCDGYSAGKYVLTADLARMSYGDRFFGGAVGAAGRIEGKFSTNHGVTRDTADGTLLIADRERQWVQRVTPAGAFVEGIDTGGANPCDVDLVQHGGKRLMVVGCLVGPERTPGVVQVLLDGEVVSSLRPKLDLGLVDFQHIHNAAGVVVDGKLFVLCYGWNPGCFAVVEHVAAVK